MPAKKKVEPTLTEEKKTPVKKTPVKKAPAKKATTPRKTKTDKPLEMDLKVKIDPEQLAVDLPEEPKVLFNTDGLRTVDYYMIGAMSLIAIVEILTWF